jgi:Tfp pilus assembly protein PilF
LRSILRSATLPALAFADFYLRHDAGTARREFQRAIALAPQSAVAHHWYATFLLEMAEYPAAINEIDKAAALDTASIRVLRFCAVCPNSAA